MTLSRKLSVQSVFKATESNDWDMAAIAQSETRIFHPVITTGTFHWVIKSQTSISHDCACGGQPNETCFTSSNGTITHWYCAPNPVPTRFASRILYDQSTR